MSLGVRSPINGWAILNSPYGTNGHTFQKQRIFCRKEGGSYV